MWNYSYLTLASLAGNILLLIMFLSLLVSRRKIFNNLDALSKILEKTDFCSLKPLALKGVSVHLLAFINVLDKLFERLKKGFEQEKHFSSDASHALRTPMSAAKIQSQVAMKAVTEEERNKALALVVESIDRGKHIIDQLLVIRRVIALASAENVFSEVSLHQLAVEAISAKVPSAIQENIEIELVSEDKKCILPNNREMLEILLANILDNAVRFTPAGGNIYVYIEKENQCCVLRVVDTGPGIPDELRVQAFEPFFQELGYKSSGNGLGLAIVNQIAKLCGLTVTLNSSPLPQTGLEVKIEFPIFQ